jgi:hypothetical protein
MVEAASRQEENAADPNDDGAASATSKAVYQRMRRDQPSLVEVRNSHGALATVYWTEMSKVFEERDAPPPAARQLTGQRVFKAPIVQSDDSFYRQGRVARGPPQSRPSDEHVEEALLGANDPNSSFYDDPAFYTGHEEEVPFEGGQEPPEEEVPFEGGQVPPEEPMDVTADAAGEEAGDGAVDEEADQEDDDDALLAAAAGDTPSQAQSPPNSDVLLQTPDPSEVD